MEDYKEKLKEALNSDNTDYEVVRWIEQNFSELKESEDDKSKKWILEYLYDGLRKSDEQFKDHFKAAIAWLEKQGEHKPNPCDGCINRKGCINCENGELREA